MKGKGKAITPAPFWVWEGLATHTPAAAELAAQAADVASAAKYFEVSTASLLQRPLFVSVSRQKAYSISPHSAHVSHAVHV